MVLFKEVWMYSPWIITIIVVALIFLIIVIYWIVSSTSSTTSQLNTDLTSLRETIINDSYLHRLLMIEIINDKAEAPNTSLPSETITFSKMATGMNVFGKSLVRAFGVVIAQRIGTLMHKRNEILRDYYWSLRRMTCSNGECVVDLINPKEDIKISTPVFPPIFQEYIRKPQTFISRALTSEQGLDITTSTERKLEAITREITDQVAGSFNIRDIDPEHNRPLIHFQRLFNLITMYDKELVNQAKSYASQYYDISMNCAQSSLEITRHLSDEFAVIMRQTQGSVMIKS